MPAPCGWDEQKNPGHNLHVLYGALVGGPEADDGYTDDRLDYALAVILLPYLLKRNCWSVAQGTQLSFDLKVAQHYKLSSVVVYFFQNKGWSNVHFPLNHSRKDSQNGKVLENHAQVLYRI